MQKNFAILFFSSTFAPKFLHTIVQTAPGEGAGRLFLSAYIYKYVQRGRASTTENQNKTTHIINFSNIFIMRQKTLLKTMLLLCALIVGSGSAWAQETLWSEDFSSFSKDAVPSGGTYSYSCTNGAGTSAGETKVMDENLAGGDAKPELMVGKKGSGTGAAGGKFTAVIPLNNIEGTLTLTYYQNKQSLKVSSTTEGVSGGQTLKPSDVGQQTTTFTGITTSMTSITIVFEATTTNNVRLDDIVLTGNKASNVADPSFPLAQGFYGSAQTVTITTNEEGGTTYYTIDGSSPTIASTPYTGGITISTTTTIKAITYKGEEKSGVVSATYAIAKDGEFDFVSAGAAGYDYGSGVELTDNGSTYVTDSKTWTSGNVTMVTSKVSGSGYRWWSADGTLRFYNKSKATFSVPSGYVITKIVTTGANFDEATPTGLSGNTWTGASDEVELVATATRNIKTITVTYISTSQTKTVESYGWATYITPAPVQFSSGDAYVVTAASIADGLTVEGVTSVPANTPVLLKGEGDKTITVLTTAPAAPTTNLLEVCNGTIADGKYPYVLAKNGEGACFKQWTGEATVLKNRVVLPLSESIATARSIFMLDGETQGISDIVTISDNRYYDLQGRSVMQPKKGLYIVNGKKVIMK